MLKMIRELFSLLTENQVRQFYVLQLLVVVMAFTELISIASIAPFMAIVGDISLLEKGGLLSELYEFSGISNPTDFVFYTGLAVLLTLSFSTAISMFTIWRLSLYAARIGTEIADRLYIYYMYQDWLFHANTSSAHLTKQVSSEAMRVTDTIIQPLLQMNARIVLSIFISFGILIYNPMIALSGLMVFACAYILLYKIVRKRLQMNGDSISLIFTERFRLMNEGFGGIKDVMLLNRRDNFVNSFKNSGTVFADAYGSNSSLSQVPRYFMELIAYGSMIGLILLLIKTHQGDLGAVLPILSVYALAAFKLLPALQQIYSSVAQIKGNTAAFEAIKEDLAKSINTQQALSEGNINQHLSIKHEVSLNNISFSYPGKNTLAVDKLNISIPANSTIGLVGASGSGKSTLIDLLLGLLTPKVGELRIDDICINDTNKRAWQNTIGFVPQSIFLSEGTIAENVAFGLAKKDINLEQVNKALQLANLTELLKQLPDGIDTRVGERGIQLSGGQRQRIGIARSLYNEADVLVFDEATSALDGITEKIIMESINEFSGQKTIIMIAHRLKTVQNCDIIYMMDKGRVIDKGTYQHLIENNPKFKEMAEHS